MAELADASDSKSDGRKGRVGSIPTGGTILEISRLSNYVWKSFFDSQSSPDDGR